MISLGSDNFKRLGSLALLWLALPMVLAVVSATFLEDAELVRYLRSAVELAFDFKARQALGREPEVSPRLKVLSYDDPAADLLGTAELPDARLLQVLEALVKMRPAAILVDRTFVFGIRDPAVRQRFAALIGSEVPIAVGAYLSPVAVGQRPELETDRTELRWPTGTPWLRVRPLIPFGPHPSVIGGFHKVGHLSYSDAGFFEPYVRFHNDRALPHLAMHAAQSIDVRDNGLWIDGVKVPLTDGRTIVNVLSVPRYKGRIFSMRSVFEVLDAGGNLEGAINQDDVVLVTGSNVTGNSGELHDTPLGRMRSSHILAAEVNSVLTGQWVRSLRRLDLAVFLGVELALALGLVANSLVFFAVLLSAVILWVGSGLLIFTWMSLDLPWLISGLILIIVAVAQHARTVFKTQLKLSVLKQALHRLVADEKLERLAKKPGKISLAPQEQLVSILFFDLVGFSLLSERRTPSQLFAQLKEILNLIFDTVYEHGGMVDTILGDGALCTFGFSIESQQVSPDHADRAVDCAIAIQNRVMTRNLAATQGTDVFPVRVGVHSAAAFMGDLGGRGRIDLTVIGPGVNFAKRLEEACEPYRIMISAATMDVLKTSRERVLPLTMRRDINIKHHSQLFEAYEIDPIKDRPHLLMDALMQYRTVQGRQRAEERYLVDTGLRLPVHFPMGTAYIEDFSRSGLRISADFYVSTGVQTVLTFRSEDCPLFDTLAAFRLTQVHVLIKWGRPLPSGLFALGLQFVGMPASQRQALVETLRRHGSVMADPERQSA